jgi:peptide/nickel transport system substrate-binding protein
MEEIVQSEGVTIQPYWRAIFRYIRKDLKGADMHVTFENRYQYMGFSS